MPTAQEFAETTEERAVRRAAMNVLNGQRFAELLVIPGQEQVTAYIPAFTEPGPAPPTPVTPPVPSFTPAPLPASLGASPV